MTLNAKIGVMDFLVISGCETHFKSKLWRNQLIQTWRSCIWNFQHRTDFDDPSLNFPDSKKPVPEGVKERYKSCYFAIVGQSFMKMVADSNGHAAYQNNH